MVGKQLRQLLPWEGVNGDWLRRDMRQLQSDAYSLYPAAGCVQRWMKASIKSHWWVLTSVAHTLKSEQCTDWLAWPLCKDDAHIREAVIKFFFKKSLTGTLKIVHFTVCKLYRKTQPTYKQILNSKCSEVKYIDICNLPQRIQANWVDRRMDRCIVT